MKVRVLLFARAKDLAGTETAELEVADGARVADVRDAIVTQYPKLAPLAGSLLVCVNSDYADDLTPLPADAEVACFPPVSGG